MTGEEGFIEATKVRRSQGMRAVRSDRVGSSIRDSASLRPRFGIPWQIEVTARRIRTGLIRLDRNIAPSLPTGPWERDAVSRGRSISAWGT